MAKRGRPSGSTGYGTYGSKTVPVRVPEKYAQLMPQIIHLLDNPQNLCPDLEELLKIYPDDQDVVKGLHDLIQRHLILAFL